MFPDTHLQASKPGHRGEALGKETCTIKTWLLLVCTSHNLLIPKVSAAQTPPPGDSRVPPEDPAQPVSSTAAPLSSPSLLCTGYAVLACSVPPVSRALCWVQGKYSRYPLGLDLDGEPSVGSQVWELEKCMQCIESKGEARGKPPLLAWGSTSPCLLPL